MRRTVSFGLMAAAVAVAIVASVAGWYYLATRPIDSIAVLPFANLSNADPLKGYSSCGRREPGPALSVVLSPQRTLSSLVREAACCIA